MTDDIRSEMVAALPRLRMFAYSLTGSRDLGDELVQETCERALLRIDQWRRGTSLLSWMFRIAQNIWLDRVRAVKVRGEVVDLEIVEAMPGSDGREEVDLHLTLEAVDAAMAKLPPEQRAIVALVCIEGVSYKEAAEITGVPIGTVMSRLARARQTLHAILEGSAPAPQQRVSIAKIGP